MWNGVSMHVDDTPLLGSLHDGSGIQMNSDLVQILMMHNALEKKEER